MTITAAETRKLSTSTSELLLDIEDVLLGADALPAELLQPLADDLAPLRERLRRHLANLVRAKRTTKPSSPAAPTRRAVAKRACASAGKR